MPSIRLFVLDEHDVVRDGLTLLVEGVGDIEMVGQASTVAAALQEIPRLRPDVAIVDVELPDGGGIPVVRSLLARGVQTQFVVFSCSVTEDVLIEARMAGAAGCFDKNAPRWQVLSVIRDAASGHSLIDSAMLDQVRFHRACDPLEALLPDFTAHERRIVGLIAEARTNREIGAALGVTEKTARNYVSGILGKLGLRNRTEVAVYVTRATLASRPRSCGAPPPRTAVLAVPETN